MLTVAPHIKGLIFDCDGTLADTMTLHYLAWQETLQVFGLTFPEKLFYELAGVPSDKLVVALNETLGYDLEPQAIAAAKERCFLNHLPQTQPIEPVVELAKRYKGKLPMAVATGGIPTVAGAVLQAIGLADFFEAVVTAQDVTNGKPAPDIFLEAARRLAVEPAYCQVFEDSPLGLAGAERAGMVATDIRPWANGAKSLKPAGQA
jgi:beta-phosphoglucomutase family hydrolase